jgi:hypothetical protein
MVCIIYDRYFCIGKGFSNIFDFFDYEHLFVSINLF